MSKADVVDEIHKNARVNFRRRHVVMKDIDDLWQADLMDVQNISKQNSDYKYIFVIIDTFSKYAWAYPLKRKTKLLVFNILQNMFKKGRVPKNFQTDNGTEFYNEKIKNLTSDYNINHYSTFTTKKASIAERLIRTLKSKMYKEFSLKGNYKWMDGTLDKVVQKYNHTRHRTIGLCPAQVNQGTKRLVLNKYSKISRTDANLSKSTKLKVGDFVRISKYKSTFEKGFTPNWSTEIFQIIKVQNTTPITYLIKDANHQPILGAFYQEEIQKTKYPHIYLIEKILKRKGNKLYVKWLGLPLTENSWINKTDIV